MAGESAMQQAKQMNRIIHKISIYIAARYVRLFCLVGLAVNFVVQVVYQYAVTALILLLCYAVLPEVIGILLKNNKKDGNTIILEELQHKYGYTKVRVKSLFISYCIMLLFFFVWQYANGTSSITHYFIKIYPSILIGSSMLVYFGTYCYNRIKIPYLVKNNLV